MLWPDGVFGKDNVATYGLRKTDRCAQDGYGLVMDLFWYTTQISQFRNFVFS